MSRRRGGRSRELSALLRTLALAAALLVGVDAQAVAARAGAAMTAQLDEIVRSEVARGFSGAVLVARGDTVLLDKGYGAIKGVAIRSDSKFWISSTGKQFASAAVLACRDEGWLTLDDPVARFFPDAPADKRAITIRQLLSHLSGFAQSYVSEGHATRAAAVAAILAEPLTDAPGNKFHYSNSNFQLAAAIVEVASGDDYQHFILNKLLLRAGLHDTGFSSHGGWRLPVPGREEMPAHLSAPEWGAEGWFSTTHDLYRWYRALRAGRVLRPGSVAELFTPVAPIQEGRAALGWFIGTTDTGIVRVFTRGNDDWGPNSLLYAYPDSDMIVIVLTHAGMADADNSWSRLIHRRIERALFT
jgi:CubicO group peptidase (beta-lactamase class C family)